MPLLSKKSYIEVLRKTIPPNLKDKPSSKILIEFIKRFGREEYDYSELSNAISMINRIEISLPREKSDDIELTPHNIITSDFILIKITPWVEKVRENILETSSAPFDWESAIEWIKNEEGKVKTIPKKELDSLRKEIKLFQLKYGLEVDFRFRFLPYKKRNESFIYQAPTIGNIKLTNLERETRSIEKATGFPQHALVLFILTGIEPIFPGEIVTSSLVSHKLSERKVLFRNEVLLKIKRKDFTFRELQKVYKKIREELNIEKDKPLNDKHLRILTHVRELGDPPKHGNGYWQYWKKVKEKWNEKNPDYEYRSWQGICKAYESIISDLEKNHISNY